MIRFHSLLETKDQISEMFVIFIRFIQKIISTLYQFYQRALLGIP